MKIIFSSEVSISLSIVQPYSYSCALSKVRSGIFNLSL